MAEPAKGGPWTGYAPESERPPLGAYAVLSSGFLLAIGAFLVARGRKLPDALSARDLALIGTGAFKLSRILTREKVAAFIRAPFTEYAGKGDAPGEVEERPRGSGSRAALGELLTCPYCIGMWIVSVLTAGMVAAPRQTRFVTSLLSALGLADFLQVAYRSAVARREPT